LIAGIEYIHKSGVSHRDLKPENLLLDYDKTLKIVDFGLSNLYDYPDGLLKTACGSPCYAAPEMIAGKQY
jgi:5'-AMP-activated protein kinase catalytic alpha subunit